MKPLTRRNYPFRVIAILLTLASSAACGKIDKPPADPKILGSCDGFNFSGEHVCADLISTDQTNVQPACASAGGTYSVSPCSTANISLSCQMVNPQRTVIARYYAPTTSTDAQANCDNSTGNGIGAMWLGSN